VTAVPETTFTATPGLLVVKPSLVKSTVTSTRDLLKLTRRQRHLRRSPKVTRFRSGEMTQDDSRISGISSQ
jgi:hypothetical protein